MKKIVLFILSIIIFSCSTNDESINDSEYSEYITRNTIDTDINFMPEEVFSNSGTPESPTLKLSLSTTQVFPCHNYVLATTEFTNGNELIIRFDEILEPVFCLTAVGPAVSYIDLPQNIDRITFINGNIIDKYSVKIDSEAVSIVLIERNFTNSIYTKTFKYPENSFAFVCGTNIDNTNIYEDFSTIIAQNPDFTQFEFEGEGRIPYPESSNGNYVNHPSKYFKYSNPEEYNNLANTLNQYSIENIEENSGVTIAIYGWNNKNYYSWIHN